MIKWSDGLSVGIDEIDQQHQQLLEIIDEMGSSIEMYDDETIIGLTLTRLESYAQFHFLTEERYFALHEYPLAEEHAQKHRDLNYQVKKLFGRFFNGGEDIREELVGLLAVWLEDHLKTEDMKYAEYFRGKGVI